MQIVYESSMSTIVPALAQQRRGLETWALRENTAYRILPGAELLAADTTLRATLGGRVLHWHEETSSFPAAIRFTPGFMLLEIHVGASVQRFGIEVVPNRDKLDETTWLRMLEDLEAWHAGLVVGMGAGGLGKVDTSGVDAEILAAALLPLVPALIAAVRRVVRSPRELQRAIREDVPLHAVRRADRTAIRTAVKDARVRVALDRWAPEWSGLDQPLISHRRIVDTLDHPVNKFLAWMLRRVASRLVRISSVLGEESTRRRYNEETKQLCRDRADAARLAAHELKRVRRNSFLGQLDPRPPTPAALQILHDDPLYARVYRLARPFFRPRFRPIASPDPERAAPARESFDLYELWTLLATVRGLELARPDLSWRWTASPGQSLLPGFGFGSTFVGRAESGVQISVEYNPTFGSFLNVRRGDRFAVSGTRRPDITVRMDTPSSSAWLVLGAKYRISRRGLAEGFESLHIYRDALRWRSTITRASVDLRPTAALILAPGCEPVCAPWFEPTFLERYGTGCWRPPPVARHHDV